MNISAVLCPICFAFVLLEGASVYSDISWGLQLHLCFTIEVGEILGYNWFSTGGIEYPSVQLIVWSKVTFRIFVS